MLNEIEHATLRMLTEKEVARMLKVSIKKLQKDRSQGTGIPYAKIGKSIRYLPQHVSEYIDENFHYTQALTSTLN